MQSYYKHNKIKLFIKLMYFIWNLYSCVYVGPVQTFFHSEELTSRCVWKEPGFHEEEAALVKEGSSSLWLYLCIRWEERGSYNSHINILELNIAYPKRKRSPAARMIVNITVLLNILEGNQL